LSDITPRVDKLAWARGAPCKSSTTSRTCSVNVNEGRHGRDFQDGSSGQAWIYRSVKSAARRSRSAYAQVVLRFTPSHLIWSHLTFLTSPAKELWQGFPFWQVPPPQYAAAISGQGRDPTLRLGVLGVLGFLGAQCFGKSIAKYASIHSSPSLTTQDTREMASLIPLRSLV